MSKKDMTNLERIAEKYDLIILSDEVYEHLVYDNKKHLSFAAFQSFLIDLLLSFLLEKHFM